MTHVVVVTASAQRDLSRVTPRSVPAIIEFNYGELSKAPRRVGKPLRNELEGLYGARRGPYRILYEIDDGTETVSVIRVDHRAGVYCPR